jgi:hypothetical protein
MKIKATSAQCEAIYATRSITDNTKRKAAKSKIFKEIRKSFGLIGTKKIGIRSVTDSSNPDKYGVIYDTKSKTDLDDGVVAPVVVAKPAKVDTVKTVTKAPVVAKPVATTVPGTSPVKTSKHRIEIRTTINGKRIRLGYASSEKAKAAAIAAAKG